MTSRFVGRPVNFVFSQVVWSDQLITPSVMATLILVGLLAELSGRTAMFLDLGFATRGFGL